MHELLTDEYWNNRYNNGTDVWSLNTPTPYFVRLLDKYTGKIKIVIPGAGKSYDAVYAAGMGHDVTVIDFSEEALNITRLLAEENNVNVTLVKSDFFDLPESIKHSYDLLFEYVTLCSLPAEKTGEFIAAFQTLLKPGGEFVSLLFPVDRRKGGPPFAINEKEFRHQMKKYFNLLWCNTQVSASIKPRKGNEHEYVFRKR